MTMISTEYDELNEKVKYAKSIEHPGYLSSYHRKPEDIEPREWINIIRSFYTRKGRIVKDVLASVEFKRDPYDPYPLKSEQIGWGVEVVWRYYG